jgi:hypothetical protein
MGTTDSALYYVYGRIGALLVDNRSDQIVLTAEVGRETLRIQAFAETGSAKNPFEAYVASGSQTINDVKLQTQWSHKFNDRWGFTAYTAVAVGQVYGDGLAVAVTGIGSVNADERDAIVWGEYGLRLGYQLDRVTAMNVFINGTLAGADIESDMRGGISLTSGF